MRVLVIILACIALALPARLAQAQTIGPVDPGAQMDVGPSRSTTVNGVTGVGVRPTPGASQGYLVPDARGGYVNYAPGPPVKQLPSRDDAEEVRLYARELAAQITRGVSGEATLAGVSSVPSAFVDQDTRQTSPFGRLLGEQMIYELNSRGFPVQEARGAAKPKAKKGQSQAVAVLAGSYYVDRDNVFVNARLVEPSGRVLRTGSVLIPMTPTLRRMLGIPDYNGLRPTPPTLIGARDVNDPPGSGAREPVPYSPAKKSAPRKTSKAKAKAPCPPGCEPIDVTVSAPKARPSAQESPAAQPRPAQPTPQTGQAAQPRPAQPGQAGQQAQPAPQTASPNVPPPGQPAAPAAPGR